MKKPGAKSAFLMFAATAIAFSFTPAAQATPINYDFTVLITTTNSATLKGTTLNGSFSYDSSSIVAGGNNNAINLLTALDFTLNGIVYNAATVNTGRLTFDSSGILTDFTFGTNCSPGSCMLVRSDSFIVSADGFSFFVRNPGTSAGTGSTSYSPAAVSVPEPDTLGLFGLGALMLGLFAGTRKRMC